MIYMKHSKMCQMMMMAVVVVVVTMCLSFMTTLVESFAIPVVSSPRMMMVLPSSNQNEIPFQRFTMVRSHNNDDDMNTSESSFGRVDRRDVLRRVVGTTAGVMAVTSTTTLLPAVAADAERPGVVVVAGATGQTGRRVLERLAAAAASDSNRITRVVGGVRNVEKATKALGESSTVIRGAMIQNVNAVDLSGGSTASSKVSLKHLDVVMDTIDQLADTMQGANSLIIATGFIPGNPLKMSQAAHEVDNVGTCHLIDAAKKAGISKIVMVSSILTNGRNWGQEKSPGFVVTNAFGNVLDEKLVAENYLRASGIDYTIVRPGGLKAKPPTGSLIIAAEDTLNAGEVSRDLVADVCIAALSDPKASNKVLEIIEDDESPPKVFNGLNM